jgi:hypothetical protein
MRIAVCGDHSPCSDGSVVGEAVALRLFELVKSECFVEALVRSAAMEILQDAVDEA